jgi:hypothetical protein
MRRRRKMVKRSIANVLGCLTILSIISGCSSLPKEIFVSAEPIEKPKLILPKTDELDLRDVEWVILVKENWEEQWAKLEKSGEALAFFATTDSGYESLGLNYSDLRAFIQQQDAIIAAYRSYYLEAEQEFNEANGIEKE